MKQLFAKCRPLLLAFYQYCSISAVAQSVGIGTDKPSANAVLDVYSTNKGLLFPRVDTAAVANPSAGLLVYSQQLRSPAFYNGSRWNKLATGSAAGALAASVLPAPSAITYTIDSGSGPIQSGTFTNITSLNNGISSPTNFSSTTAGRAAFANVVIQKAIDANSIPFINALTTGRTIKTVTFDVYYAPAGVPTLYYTIKLTTVLVSSYQVNFGDQASEQIGFTAATYGYKVGSQTFAWNVQTNTLATY